MPIATTLAGQILSKVFGGADFTPDATYYIGLRAGGVELSGGDYARVAVTNNTTNFPTVTTNIIVNGVAITFPQASGNWLTADEVAIYDASSGGNLKGYGLLDTPVTVTAGQTREFAAGDLKIKIIPVA